MDPAQVKSCNGFIISLECLTVNTLNEFFSKTVPGRFHRFCLLPRGSRSPSRMDANKPRMLPGGRIFAQYAANRYHDQAKRDILGLEDDRLVNLRRGGDGSGRRRHVRMAYAQPAPASNFSAIYSHGLHDGPVLRAERRGSGGSDVARPRSADHPGCSRLCADIRRRDAFGKHLSYQSGNRSMDHAGLRRRREREPRANGRPDIDLLHTDWHLFTSAELTAKADGEPW